MLTQERSSRMIGLIADAHRALDESIESEIVLQDKQLAGICCLYSDGGDSTVLAHLFRNSRWGWAKDRPDMAGLLCHSCGAR